MQILDSTLFSFYILYIFIYNQMYYFKFVKLTDAANMTRLVILDKISNVEIKIHKL